MFGNFHKLRLRVDRQRSTQLPVVTTHTETVDNRDISEILRLIYQDVVNFTFSASDGWHPCSSSINLPENRFHSFLIADADGNWREWLLSIFPLCYALVDHEKASGSIEFTPLFTALEKQREDAAYITLLKEFYNDTTSTLRLHQDNKNKEGTTFQRECWYLVRTTPLSHSQFGKQVYHHK